MDRPTSLVTCTGLLGLFPPSKYVPNAQGDIKHDGEWIVHEFYSLVPEDDWKASSCPHVIQFWTSTTSPPAVVDSGGQCLHSNEDHC